MSKAQRAAGQRQEGVLRLVTPLLEAEESAASEDGTGGQREVLVTVIRPGTSKNGNHYSPAVVKGLAPLLEGAQAYADHPDTPGVSLRSVRDLVGYYTRPYVDPRTGALKATFRLFAGGHLDWLWSVIKETITTRAPLVGVSIDALAQTSVKQVGGRAVREVESITRLLSCDVVSRASAGGAFDALASVGAGSSGVAEGDGQGGPLGGQEGIGAWDTFGPTPPGVQGQDAGESVVGPGGPVAGAAQQQLRNTRPRDAYGRAIGGAGQDGLMLAQPLAGVQQGIGGGSAVLGRHVLIEGGRGRETGMNPDDNNVGVIEAGDEVVTIATRVLEELRDEQSTLRREIEQERKVLACERLLDSTLREAALPEIVRKRVDRRFRGRVFESAELATELEEERAVVAELSGGSGGAMGSSLVRGMGYEKMPHVSGMVSERERVQKAFDQLFDISEGERVPALSGIREAYVVATGDVGISGLTSPERQQQMLREADITTASFSFLLGTSMNKRLLKDYQAWPAEWQKFSTITPIKDFKQQDRIRMGAFGSLSTVAEDTAYTYLTLADARAIYTPTKRGNLVAVTRETIVNDDLYSIKQIPGKLAVAAAFTLAEFVYLTLLNPGGANIYDGFKLFDTTNHKNTGVATANLGVANNGTALSSAAMQTATIAMRKQQNLANKPIGLKPRFLVVPPDLEFTAMLVTKSAGIPGSPNNDINPMLGYCEVIVAPQINALASNTVTQWSMVADPRVIDTLEIGFVGGQINPALFIQDQPLFGSNFTNDVITYKVRHEYGGAVVDFRGFYLGNN